MLFATCDIQFLTQRVTSGQRWCVSQATLPGSPAQLPQCGSAPVTLTLIPLQVALYIACHRVSLHVSVCVYFFMCICICVHVCVLVCTCVFICVRVIISWMPVLPI